MDFTGAKTWISKSDARQLVLETSRTIQSQGSGYEHTYEQSV